MPKIPDSNREVQKVTLLFELAKRSLLICRDSLKRLSRDLEDLEEDIELKIDVSVRAISPLVSAMTFIDFAHRFGDAVDQIPRVKKNTLEARRLKDVLMSVNAARNHLQHLRGDLSTSDEITYPLLGNLAWSHDAVSFTLCLSQPGTGELPSMAIGPNGWVARHQYSLMDKPVDLDFVLATMEDTYSWIASCIEFKNSSFTSLRWGATQAFALRFPPGNFPPSARNRKDAATEKAVDDPSLG